MKSYSVIALFGAVASTLVASAANAAPLNPIPTIVLDFTSLFAPVVWMAVAVFAASVTAILTERDNGRTPTGARISTTSQIKAAA